MHNEWSLSKKKNGIRKRYKTLKHSSIGRKRRKKHPNERKLSTDIVFIETLNRLRLLQLLDLHINDVLFAAILFESLAKKFYFRIWFIEEKSLFSPKCVSRRNSIDFFLACTVSGQFNGYFLLYNWSASILSFIHEMEQKQKQLTQKKNYNFRFVLLLLWLFLVSSLSIRRPFAFPVYRSPFGIPIQVNAYDITSDMKILCICRWIQFSTIYQTRDIWFAGDGLSPVSSCYDFVQQLDNVMCWITLPIYTSQ